MPNLVSRYMDKAADAAKAVGKGVKSYVKEAATSDNAVKAIDKTQSTSTPQQSAAQARMVARYAPPGASAKTK